MDAARTAATVMRLLDTAEMAHVERILVECAKEANFEINDADAELKGKSPTEEQCKQVVRQEKGKDVTRAMELGSKKHAVALDCVRRELGERFPDNFSVEPRYQKGPQPGQWQWINPEQVARWLRDGLESLLLGSLVPDIVIHATGNPNKVQRVYEYKFPCFPKKKDTSSWRTYPKGHPHYPKNQRELYEELGGEDVPALVTPQLGAR